ncbi:hypothetical protein ACOSP7_004447 [Xanthoceras sorbifolium]
MPLILWLKLLAANCIVYTFLIGKKLFQGLDFEGTFFFFLLHEKWKRFCTSNCFQESAFRFSECNTISPVIHTISSTECNNLKCTPLAHSTTNIPVTVCCSCFES